MNWSSRPFVRIFFFYAAGILAAYFLPLLQSLQPVLLLSVISFFGIAYYFVVRSISSRKLKLLSGLLAGMLIFVVGMFTTNQKLVYPDIQADVSQASYIAEILRDPIVTEQTVKAVLLINKVEDTLQGVSTKAKVMGFLRKDSLTSNLRVGDKFVFQSKLAQPDPPKNPVEFDYAEFLRLNGIHFITYIPSGNCAYLEGPANWQPKIIASKLRSRLLNALKENRLSGRDYAVTAAIILGYDQLMDPELEQDFVNAGAMHILCVSGLHVGVIYLVLNFILGFLNRRKSHRIIKMLLLIIIVWFYALLTGLSPSVQRASVMISVFIIGSTINRDRDSYNTLAASAVLMLLFDPLLIFNVGFQLSYAAVIGILVFHQPIYRLVYINNFVLDKIWSISVLSVAAQLGTFPLAAHYFHFFPTYFWLTNLLIFPLSFIIITTGFAFLFISWIPGISTIVGLMLSGMVFLLNSIVGMVDYLPYHGLDNLHFPWIKVLIVYGLMIFLFQLFIKKNFHFLIPALACVLGLLTLQTYYNFRQYKQHKAIVYNINGQSAIDFVKGKDHFQLADSALLFDKSKLEYHTKNHEVLLGLEENSGNIKSGQITNSIDFQYDGEFGVFGDFKFLVLKDKEYYPVDSIGKIVLDAIFVQGKRKVDVKNLENCFVFKDIVSDASVPFYKQKSLQMASDSLHKTYVNTARDGAYIIDF